VFPVLEDDPVPEEDIPVPEEGIPIPDPETIPDPDEEKPVPNARPKRNSNETGRSHFHIFNHALF
jgi:hypothetical protein